MSPARKSAKATKSKAKAPKARRARPKAAGKAKRTLGAKTGIAPGKRRAGASKAAPRRHCAATDPFGDPCQSAPRLPSRYCTIHSYLDR